MTEYEYRVRYSRKLPNGETYVGYNGPLWDLWDAAHIRDLYERKGGVVEFFDVAIEARLIVPWEEVDA